MQGKFLDLRNWMNEVAKGDLTPIEVEQKLEYLMSQYQRHMELHKLKANVGVLQTLLISTAEVLENLIKLQWGKITKIFFPFKERQIALLEAELKVPGNEVAYILKAQQARSDENSEAN